MNGFAAFAALVIGHALADYPLQGDFLARGKNPATAFPGIPWPWLLGFHAAIHAGAVWLVLWLFHVPALVVVVCVVSEFSLHALTDLLKCQEEISFSHDQALHLFCKATWATFAWLALSLAS